MAVAIEDAGFEIRDQIMYVYGSGFPKSMDIAKAIDKAAGANVIKGEPFNVVGGTNKSNGGSKFRSDHPEYVKPKAITDQAKQWQGWGTALKPAHEPMVLARKPLSEKTVAANVLTYGTGAINIDTSRVGTEQLGGGTLPDYRDVGAMSKEATGIDKLSFGQNPRPADRIEQPTYIGRFPANFIHDGSDEVTELLGEPARFFYCAKASKSERNAGLDGLTTNVGANGNKWTDQDYRRGDAEPKTERKNFHPTVKPLTLIRYLIKLVTPPNGTVLDPFLGSGTTAVAATLDNFNWVGCEMTDDYLPIIKGRVDWATKENKKAKQQELDLHENN
jgi:site-specific DNA-methyltransferase (adenine-specific)